MCLAQSRQNRADLWIVFIVRCAYRNEANRISFTKKTRHLCIQPAMRCFECFLSFPTTFCHALLYLLLVRADVKSHACKRLIKVREWGTHSTSLANSLER